MASISMNAGIIEDQKRDKNRQFFIEFVLATVLSILAANLWHDLFKRAFPEQNLFLLFILCIVITIGTIILLERLFAGNGVKIQG